MDTPLVDVEYFNRESGYWDYCCTVSGWGKAREVIDENVREARRSGNWAASVLDWRSIKAWYPAR